MKKNFKIICRNSKLSLIQATITQQLIEKKHPSLKIQIMAKASRGDLDTVTPLYAMGDKNIFTQDIENVLLDENADIAVHSLKDLSAEKLDDPTFYHAFFDRDLLQDVLIFAPDFDFDALLRGGATFRLGTSSLRRKQLIPDFLQKVIFQRTKNISILQKNDFQIEVKPIRGNVDTRLRKLQAGEFDAIVLAAAGLNRLCRFDNNVKKLLENCKIVLLPLIECPSAAGQGALIAECLQKNNEAVEILKTLNDEKLSKQLAKERFFSKKWGGGCHQRFGVVSFEIRKNLVTRIAGQTQEGENSLILDDFDIEFSAQSIKNFDVNHKKLFSSTDFMRDFFDYEFFTLTENDYECLENARIIFISHHRAIQKGVNVRLMKLLKEKQIWVSGTRTWRELAKNDIWITGSADAFGFHFLDKVFESNLFDIEKKDIVILTNEQSAKHWEMEGIKTVSSYRLKADLSDSMLHFLQEADLFFWTNFEQYEISKPFLKEGVGHACPSGKTAELFENQGLSPIIFPSIKIFLHWRKNILSV